MAVDWGEVTDRDVTLSTEATERAGTWTCLIRSLI